MRTEERHYNSIFYCSLLTIGIPEYTFCHIFNCHLLYGSYCMDSWFSVNTRWGEDTVAFLYDQYLNQGKLFWNVGGIQ